jgi:hypothetical protein
VSDDRCDHDMLPSQCGPCRGLVSVEEQADAEALATRRLLLALPGWFAANYPGSCGCGQRFPAGAAIRYSDNLDTKYRAECCGEESNRG